MCQRVNTLIEEKCSLEKENTKLQGKEGHAAMSKLYSR